MTKYTVYRTKAQPEHWDRVEFNIGWITCFNESDQDTEEVYYPAHVIESITKLWEEETLPERRLSWEDLERLS